MTIISRKEFHNINFIINGERVAKFKYLGATLNEKWDCDEEVKTRIGIAKTTYENNKYAALENFAGVDLRIWVIKCFVWPILLYGLEIWSLNVSTLNRIEAFEMWTLRRMLWISWTVNMLCLTTRFY